MTSGAVNPLGALTVANYLETKVEEVLLKTLLDETYMVANADIHV